MSKLIIILVLLYSCTPVQRNWRANTTIDVGLGSQTMNKDYAYGYMGASYWLSHGFSTTAGVWRTLLPYWGPYLGLNYSFTPLD